MAITGQLRPLSYYLGMGSATSPPPPPRQLFGYPTDRIPYYDLQQHRQRNYWEHDIPILPQRSSTYSFIDGTTNINRDRDEEEEEANNFDWDHLDQIILDQIRELSLVDANYNSIGGLFKDEIDRHMKTRDDHQYASDEDICVVCQYCLVQEGEKIATLDCGHDFHAGCIKPWLMRDNRCPLCKATGIRQLL